MNRTLPARGEVHVWFCDAGRPGGRDADAIGDIALLSREEKIRCARIPRPAERRGFAAARAGARRVLADLVGAAPETIDLSAGMWTSAGRRPWGEVPALHAGPCATPLVLDLVWSADAWVLGLSAGVRLCLALERVEGQACAASARERVRRKALARLSGAERTTAPQEVSGNFWVHDVPTPASAVAAVACSGRHRRAGGPALLLREVPVVT
ncbi:hypothetical protein [Streptomyces aureoversilis]|uniref:Uncharacterized protein n=1 Tax=Streptomyces aureoversilis TaxID=67277 RepID=A0ABV9ZYS9_9ACTN